MTGRAEESVEHRALTAAPVEGEPLARYLARVGRLPVLQGFALALQLLSAVDALHRQGAVHGRITASHLLVSSNGRLLLPDLDEHMAVATELGTVRATSDVGVQAGQQRDVLAAAVVTYELLTGASPFESNGRHAGLPGERSESPRPVRAFRPELPLRVDAVFERALAPSPGERYRTAAEFSEALQAAIPAPCWQRPAVPARRPHDAPRSGAVPTNLATAADPRTPARTLAPVWGAKGRRVGLALAGGCAAVVAVLVVASLMGDEPSARAANGADLQPPMARRNTDASQEQAAAQLVRVDPLRLERTLEPGAPAKEQEALGTATQREPETTSERLPQLPAAAVRERPSAAVSTSHHRSARRESTAVAKSEPPLRRLAVRAGPPLAPSPDAACRHDFSIAPELCMAFQCATAEFRGHPVCVRMHADGARARARLADSRGGP